MTEDKPGTILPQRSAPKIPFRFLPWMIAGGVFVIYLITLNHWVTMKSLASAARVADWDWRLVTTAPLYFLLTYPTKWLGGNAQLVALNALAAIFGALTLALLARSIQLLPHDRTRDQRQRETGKGGLLNLKMAWLPPVAAAIVCGLQLTFWEHAIAGTGEMLDLLLFAYVIRCLLEYRHSKNENWLAKFALIYGLGVANNWAMIGFFPLFLVAVIWIKGFAFFQFRFITRTLLFGLAGLSLYLLLPLIVMGQHDQGFFGALKENLRMQKSYVYSLPFAQVTALRSRLLMMALTSLLPLLILAIRWPSFRGDISPAGTAATAFMFRLMHLVFLGVGLWIFFDPVISARELGFKLLPYLTFYYLTALGVGYFIGYVLLVFGTKPLQAWERARGAFKMIERGIVVVVIFAALLVPVALAWKNFPIIRANNGEATYEYFRTVSDSLPNEGAVILSDDANRLALLRAAETRLGKAGKNVLLDTAALPFPIYHDHLVQRFPNIWQPVSTNLPVNEFGLLLRLDHLSKTRPIYYLHPSFGYYFERFYAVPHKLVYELKVYPTNRIAAPPLNDAIIAENQKYWTGFMNETLPRLAGDKVEDTDLQMLSGYYSRALNYWGVELQKTKRLAEAGEAFAAAIKLNPENVVAEINLQFNASLQKGQVASRQTDEQTEAKLGQYRSLQMAMNWNGPFDEPNFCARIGEVFAHGHNTRQSAQHFQRTLDFDPTHFPARLGLAKTYIELQRADEALRLIKNLQSEPTNSLTDPMLEFELLRVESLAHLAKSDVRGAEKILVDSATRNPKDPQRQSLLTQFYLDVGQLTNALQSAEKQLQMNKEDPRALFVKGVVQMQLNRFAPAVATFDHLLELKPDHHTALFNRAIANLQSGKLADARRDYEALREIQPETMYQIHFGLAKIADTEKDKSTALRNYKLYLKHAPAGTSEYEGVKQRIKELEGDNA